MPDKSLVFDGGPVIGAPEPQRFAYILFDHLGDVIMIIADMPDSKTQRLSLADEMFSCVAEGGHVERHPLDQARRIFAEKF